MDGLEPLSDAELAETNSLGFQRSLLAVAWQMALQRALTVTFRGAYNQGTLLKPDGNCFSPFVIAQDSHELELLAQGRLQGHIFEAGMMADIFDGEITPTEIAFNKRYVGGVFPDGRRISGSTINSAVIVYRGTLTEHGKLTEQQEYSGRWSFDPSATNDLATEGTFEMRRVLVAQRKRHY